MAEPSTISNDRDLVGAARSGDDEAWEALVDRHRPAIDRVARAIRPPGSTARVDAALGEVLASVRSGDFDPDSLGRPEPATAQLRDVRCRMLAALSGAAAGPALPAPHQLVDEARRTEVPDRRDLVALADAFLLAPWAWQTALWHGVVEGRAAAEVSPMLGRSPNEVTAAVHAAQAGVFELYVRADAARIGDLDSTSAALLGLVGGYRRDVLSPTDRRRVDELLERRTDGSPDGIHAARWLAVGAALDTLLPDALVPGLVGTSPAALRAALGVGVGAVGAAGLAAARSERVERSARLGAVLAIILAILAAAFLIRNPFDGLDASFINDLIATSTVPDDSTTGTTLSPTTTVVGDGEEAIDTVDDRADLVFPGARQGAVYVPGQELLDLSMVLSRDRPFVAGGTGSVRAAITNHAESAASVQFDVRTTPGLSLAAEQVRGATCSRSPGGVTTCRFTLRPRDTATLTLVFELDESLLGTVTIVPSIPGRALDVEIV